MPYLGTKSHTGGRRFPEWPALLDATTTATLILRADPSYPTVALFHVSLTLEKDSETDNSECRHALLTQH